MTAPHAVESFWRQGATRLGIPFAEYRACVEAGLKWCSHRGRGHGWRPVAEFGIARGKRDGLATYCRECDRETALARIRARRSGRAS